MGSTTMTNPLGVPTTIDSMVLSTSLADYQKRLVDNIYNTNVILRLANEAGNKKMINGGVSIVETLIRDKQNAGGFYLGADVLNNTQVNTTTLLEYKWQNAYEPIVINRDEERQNSGDMHKIIDLVGTKIQLSERAINDRLESALSTPAGDANNLIDLETLVSTGTLGSVAGASNTFWQSNNTTSGAFATQGLTDMTTATYAVSASATVDNPTHYITNKTIFQKFEQTRLPLERISNGTLSANAGFTNLTFKGKPVTYGNYIGSGLLFGLNMNYIYLAVDTETDFITTPFISPTNQTIKVAYILWRGNLLTNNRRRHFKLSSIS
jgi:hypothetical protein